MSKSIDPLRTTAPELHRIWFMISTEKQWYQIMRECRQEFAANWRTMPKVRKKLLRTMRASSGLDPVWVWFDVPDPKFATYIALKVPAPISLEKPGPQKINKSCF